MNLRPAHRLAAGAAAALLLTGCGAGQRAQTYQEKAVADATNDAVGAIAVRNIAVLGPEEGIVLEEGTDAPLSVMFVNQGAEDDVLLAASSPAARAVDVVGPEQDLTVPRLGVSDTSYSLVLRDLTRDLATGSYIDVTLEFERNGTKTLLVPVQTTPEGAPRDPDFHYEITETDSAGKPLVEQEEQEGGDNATEEARQSEGDQGNADTPSSG